MAATWILRNKLTSKILWTGAGPEAPEIMTDTEILKRIFKDNFPQVQIQWGGGEFEVVYSSMDATYNVGQVAAYVINREGPDGLEIEASGDVIIKAEGARLDVGARVVTDFQSEVDYRLGNHGLPQGIRVEDGVPQPMAQEIRSAGFGDPIPELVSQKDMASPAYVREQVSFGQEHPMEALISLAEAGAAKRAGDAPLPLEEAADFTLLLKNARKSLLPRRAEWPRLIAGIPRSVIEHFREHPEGVNLEEKALKGRMFIGMTDDGQSYSLLTDTFLVDDCSPKTRLYIRWMLNYQEVESQVLDHMNNRQDLDPEQCYQLALEMFADATELYLLEKGVDIYAIPSKIGDFSPIVRQEMEARAEFVANKDAEYGQPIRRHGIYGVVVRVFDKIARFTNLKAGAVEAPRFESALDSLKDLGGYSLILAGMFLEELIAITPAQAPRAEKE